MLFDVRDLPDPQSDKGPENNKPKSRGRRQDAKPKDRRLAARQSKCQEVLGEIRQGMCLHLVSMGDWSAHDMILHALDFTGPAELWFSTWSISEDAFRKIVRAKNAGLIREIHGIADWRCTTWSGDAIQLVKEQADRFAMVPAHAKLYVLRSDKWGVVIQSSANMTNNPRIETSIITEDPELADWHIGWIDEVLRGAEPFDPGEPDHAAQETA